MEKIKPEYGKDYKVREALTKMEMDAMLKQLDRSIDNMVETKKTKEKFKDEIHGYFVEDKKEGKRK